MEHPHGVKLGSRCQEQVGYWQNKKEIASVLEVCKHIGKLAQVSSEESLKDHPSDSQWGHMAKAGSKCPRLTHTQLVQSPGP